MMEEEMKSRLYLLIVLLVAISLFVGACAQPTTPAPAEEVEVEEPVAEEPTEVSEEEPTQLILWAQESGLGEANAYNLIIEDFKEKYPNIEVETNFVDFETYRSLIKVAVASDEPPDVFKYWAGAWPKFMADEGLLEDIGDLWDENGLNDRYADWAKALNTYDGVTYGVPMRSFTSAMWYLDDEFEKYGIEVPEDRWIEWDDLIGYCEEIRDQGGTPIILSGKNQWPLQYALGSIAMNMDGGQFWSDLLLGKESWEDPQVTAWFEKWIEMFEADCFQENMNSIDWQQAENAVLDGSAAMTFGLSSMVPAAATFNPDAELNFFHWPIMNPDQPKQMHHQTDSFFMTKKARNPEAARLWLVHISQLEEACKYPKEIYYPPAHKGVDTECYPDDKFGQLIFAVNQERDKYPGPNSLDIGLQPEVAAEAMRQLQVFVDDPTAETAAEVQAAIEKVAREVFGPLP
jgi:ABC-type glycerol-3-phosphate transport system substrate-binding protein